jgi:hypothetical protein
MSQLTQPLEQTRQKQAPPKDLKASISWKIDHYWCRPAAVEIEKY